MGVDVKFESGRVFAGHRVVRFIAAGGMGTVYAAVDLSLERWVALKVITHDEAEDEGFRSRFVREARLLAGLDHPHVLPIYQAGQEEGLLYLTMRLVSGGSLREYLELRGALAPGHALRLLSPVARALDALHRRQILHRDVKPENILLEGPEGDETVWLADFGLARRMDDRSLSGSAEQFGTFDYMAPEQWLDDGPVGPRADVYALGLVLYEALTARRLDLLERNPPPMPEMEPVPVARGLHEVLRRALARPAEQRQSSAGELLEAARTAIAAGSPDAAGPVRAGRAPDGAGTASAQITFTAGTAGGTGEPGAAGDPAGMPTRRQPAGPGGGYPVPTIGAPLSGGWTGGPAAGGPRRTPRWLWPAAAVAVAVAVTASVLTLVQGGDPAAAGGPATRPRVTTVVTTTATPRESRRGRGELRPVPTRSVSRAPAPRPSGSAKPAPKRLAVCAKDLGVREAPLPVTETRVVATLHNGDFFTVTAAKGKTWVFGQSAGSANVTGWTFREYLKPSCR